MDVDTPQEISLREPPAVPVATMEPMEPQDATMTNPPAQSSDLSNPPSPTPDPTQQHPLETVQPPTEPTQPPRRSRLPDSRIHSDWKPSAVAMAKCDICDQRGRGTVYMCTACSQSVCRDCCAEGRLGAGHVLDHTSVSWDLHLATKTERPKKKRAASSGRGRGGRATKTRASRAGSARSRDATLEVEEVKHSSNSSGLSDPPTSHGSSPTRVSIQRTEEVHEVQEVPAPVVELTRDVAIRQQQPRSLPRIREMGPRQSHGEPSSSRAPYMQYQQQGQHLTQPGQHYMQQGQHYSQHGQPYNQQNQQYTQQDQRYHPYSRQPSQTSYTSHGRAPEQYPRLPTEDHRPLFRNPAYQEPVPAPPTSHDLSLLSLLRDPPIRLPAGCPVFADLRADLIASVHAIADEMRTASLETHLYTAVSRAWTRGRLLSHLRAVNEPAAFRIFLASSNSAFVALGAPRDHAARQWFKDMEEQLVAAGAMEPLRVSMFQRAPPRGGASQDGSRD